jgi:hypothetical protein|tara:strand:+ start:1375 stop:2067 length:693 start_codon:yes stop_codon:yes gene_type:complete
MNIASVLVLCTATLGGRGGGINNDFSITTSGPDILWTCPDVLETNGSWYEMAYEVTGASVMVEYIGIEFGPIDILDMIPTDAIVTWQPAQAPMPIDFGWYDVSGPEDQDPPALSYRWIAEVNEKGIVTWSGQEVYLGEAEYDLGWPFGSVTVNIIEGTIDANIEIIIVENPCYEDIDGNGSVDVSDLLTLIGNWGHCPDCTEEIPGDVNYDDVVDVTDLLRIVGAWGPCS